MSQPTTSLPTTEPTRIAVLVGSLRAGSINRRVAEQLRDHASDTGDVVVELVEGLDRLPFFNEDLDGETVPSEVVRVRDSIGAADRVLVVTPEFNGTMPAVVNNAIDWLSRPYGAGAMVGKPFAVVGVSLGQYGGSWAHDDTRRSAKVAGALVVEDIRVSLRATGDDPAVDPTLVAAVNEAVGSLVAARSAAEAAAA